MNNEQTERALTLLKATFELLKKQDESRYVLNLLATVINYDNDECDGSTLMSDIEALLLDIELCQEEQEPTKSLLEASKMDAVVRSDTDNVWTPQDSLYVEQGMSYDLQKRRL